MALPTGLEVAHPGCPQSPVVAPISLRSPRAQFPNLPVSAASSDLPTIKEVHALASMARTLTPTLTLGLLPICRGCSALLTLKERQDPASITLRPALTPTLTLTLDARCCPPPLTAPLSPRPRKATSAHPPHERHQPRGRTPTYQPPNLPTSQPPNLAGISSDLPTANSRYPRR